MMELLVRLRLLMLLPVVAVAVESLPLYAQFADALWIRHLAVGRQEGWNTDITTDGAGNVYVHGLISAESTFGDIVLPGRTLPIGYTAKYSSDGVLQWARQDSMVCSAIAVDGVGNTYKMGIYQWPTIDLGDTVLVMEQYEGFLVKQNAGGEVVWARIIQAGEARGLVVDSAGSVYTGTVDLYRDSAWVVRYNTDGQEMWRRHITGRALFTMPALAINRAGDVVVAGELAGDLETADTVVHSDERSLFAMSFSADGHLLSVSRVDDPQASVFEINDICIDEQRRVLLTGTMSGGRLVAGADSVVNPNGWDGFFIRYDSSGTVRWMKLALSLSRVFGRGAAAIDGYLYLMGEFSDTLHIGDRTVYSSYPGNIFLAQVEEGGQIININPAVATSERQFIFSQMCKDGQNRVYISGVFERSMTVGNTTLLNAGLTDSFLARLDERTTGVDEHQLLHIDCSVYPHPASNAVFVGFPSGLHSARMEIVNLSGRTVYSRVLAPVDSGTALHIPLGGVAPGVYLLSVVAPDGGRTTRTLVVVR